MGKCGSVALDIRTYCAGLNQPTHPNVISFDSPWHGYRYYMAYTPYPYANGFEETPCIAASNDMIHWESPTGAVNPIATSEELACDELKDSHLLYRKDLDRLEMWYLGRINSTMAEGGQLHCLRKVSANGRCWSNYEVMYSFDKFNLVSESVIYNGAYQFWGIRYSKEDTGLYFMYSEDGVHWSEPEKCDIPDATSTDMWHGTVSYQDGIYYFVWVGHAGKPCNQIFYSVSTDGFHFSSPQVMIENDSGWEYLYRPCLLKKEEILHCYYGVIRCDGKWMISLSRGEEIQEMAGVTPADLGTTSQPLHELIASDTKMRIQRCMTDTAMFFTPRLLILIPLLILLRFLQISPVMAWVVSMICCIVCSFLLVDRKKVIRRGIIMGTANACIAAFLAEMLLQMLQMF